MAKKRKRTKSTKAMRLKLKPQTIFSIVQISFFLLAVLVIVSFLRQGLLLQKVNDFFIFLFSWVSIFLPFIFVSFAFLVSKTKTVIGQPNVVVGSVLMFLSLCGITRSGIVGSSSWEGIASLATSIGAFFVFIALLFMSLVILLNTSVDQVFLFFAKMFNQYVIRKFPVFTSNTTKDSLLPKKELKVLGSKLNDLSLNKTQPNLSINVGLNDKEAEEPVKKDPNLSLSVAQAIASNIPGEEKIWKYPPVDLLNDELVKKADRGDVKRNASTIEQTLESFGITARVVEVNPGPAVTQYAIEVALGTKLSKITSLERDLALALAAPTGTIRIEAPIPGRSLVGIELPNRSPEFVTLKQMMESDVLRSNPSKIAVALGLDVSGKPVVADLGKMPHLLIAGQTGSGKSICINTFISTILFRASPSEVKFIMVDPKRVELTGYNGIPYLLSPVIVEPEKVISALRWIISEMNSRYKLFAEAGVRNIASYNEMSGFQALPYIVVIIDELADIMLFSPVEVEDCITKIAQMSRATGIHMVLATQRPSVDVITGLIKANIPSRIAFAVASQIDSRVILDGPGAEKLLGKGDMLYLPSDVAKPIRIQGAWISDKDNAALISFVKSQGIPPRYTEEVLNMSKHGQSSIPGVEGETDEYFAEAVKIACQFGRASASLFQRRLSIGYARAAKIMDQLEAAGVVSPSDGSSKPREVLIKNPDEVLSPASSKRD
ncbi:MAG: DNA translocase FtsK [Patescibacteria group bacterium]|nr:DNA translocase FtsK [Patescibacteria group bacterium]